MNDKFKFYLAKLNRNVSILATGFLIGIAVHEKYTLIGVLVLLVTLIGRMFLRPFEERSNMKNPENQVQLPIK